MCIDPVLKRISSLPLISPFFSSSVPFGKSYSQMPGSVLLRVFVFVFNGFFKVAFDCIRAWCRTVSSRFFLAGMEARLIM
jgi:hypothetical protein